MAEPGGWYLPKGDTYFAQFVQGPAPKLNGFQRQHLHEAFKWVQNWRIAIDVGAHVGFWTYDMAQRFERVYAFEPSADTYDCLTKNVAEFSNVTTAQFAVGAANGHAVIRDDEKRPHNTGSRYVMPYEQGGLETVPIIALDSMTWTACDFLKIDVEGFELHVLKGAESLIMTHRPVISMECSDKKFRGRYRIAPGSAERMLLEHAKYRCVAHMSPDKVFVPW